MIVCVCLSVSESEFSSLMYVCYYPCLHRTSNGKPDEKGKGLFLDRGNDFFTLDKSGGAETLLPTKNEARGIGPAQFFSLFFGGGVGCVNFFGGRIAFRPVKGRIRDFVRSHFCLKAESRKRKFYCDSAQ